MYKQVIRTSETTIKIYVPDVFNIRELMKDAGFKPRYIELHSDKFNYFLHVIWEQRVLNRKEKRDYININSKTMEKIVGSRYWQTILDYMINVWGIVETNGFYTPFEKSIGYRLTDAFVDSMGKMIAVDIVYEGFENAILRYKMNKLSELDDVTRWIELNLRDLGIDTVRAYHIIDQWYLSEVMNCQNQVELLSIEEKRVIYTSMVERLSNGNYHCSRDKKGKRVHNNLTNLWRMLRPCLYLKYNRQQELVYLDVRNCQPFIFSKILLTYYPQAKITGIPGTGTTTPDDVLQYLEMVSVGKLYDYLCDLWDISDDDKTDFKTNLFGKVFYCSNQDSINSEFGRAFRDQFPNVYEVIWLEKVNDFKSLSISMQWFESKAIIDGVMADLMKTYGDKEFFMVLHDAVICKPEHIDVVKSLLSTHLVDIVGIPCTVKDAEPFNTVLSGEFIIGQNEEPNLIKSVA